MEKFEIFDYIKNIYNQSYPNKLVYNLDSIKINDIFVLVEIFEFFKNDDEAQVKKLLASLSEKEELRLLELTKIDHVLLVVSAFVKNKITSKELLSLFENEQLLEDGL